ncbi:MAG: ATP-dependent DNA helicase RecG [Deltaproteobacteria bacterium]|nr:ATP-dependent DNA helicase RecG [Deltaproteobacteria bacterium]
MGPLRFAARDDYAGIDRVVDLERAVARSLTQVQSLAVPRGLRTRLARIAKAFEAPLEGAKRRKTVARALEVLAPMAAPSFAEDLLVRPLSVLPGVGPKRAATFARRSLGCVADLLFHLPARYDDRRALLSVEALQVGLRATFVARVLLVDFVTSRGRGGRFRRVLQAVVGDDTGTVNLKWFHGGEALQGILTKGARILVTGDVRRYRFHKELLHPDVDVLGEDESAPEDPELQRLVADYPALEGVNPRAVRRLLAAALDEYADLVGGHLPEALVLQRRLPEPADALRGVHRPSPDEDVEALRERRSPAYERLVLEELYLLEVGLALRRAAQADRPGIAIRGDGPRTRAAPDALPFRLTGAQRRVWGEIRADLERPHPMNRLLQGDVGSGKTAVAFLAAVAVAESGRQTALMAPTELLAEQHARTLRHLAESGGEATALRIELLTASVPRADAEGVRARVAAGEADLVLGTHALVQRDVRFADLALAVVDEQHRFGVLQRAALGAKGGVAPDVLVMTATPIPRTLALTLYGDLDLSVIDEMPPGRTPVVTEVFRQGQGERVVQLIHQTAARGEQIYVVYPLVEESEKMDLRAAVESAQRIARAFPELRVDLVHGRLDAAARAEAMRRFRCGETQVLVSTSVIEVGVDVPNATLIIVEHAERFGLAQLHQLRGRVGRGTRPGTCALVARGGGEGSEARIEAMLETTDGFRIADADLRIRGPGEFLGTRQHGKLPDLRIADLVRDARLVSVAREAALAQVRDDPGLSQASALRDAVRARWGSRLALADVG